MVLRRVAVKSIRELDNVFPEAPGGGPARSDARSRILLFTFFLWASLKPGCSKHVWCILFAFALALIVHACVKSGNGIHATNANEASQAPTNSSGAQVVGV